MTLQLQTFYKKKSFHVFYRLMYNYTLTQKYLKMLQRVCLILLKLNSCHLDYMISKIHIIN